MLTAAVARYRCLAVNNNLTEAAETELRINMLCECGPGLVAFKLISTIPELFSSPPRRQDILGRGALRRGSRLLREVRAGYWLLCDAGCVMCKLVL